MGWIRRWVFYEFVNNAAAMRESDGATADDLGQAATTAQNYCEWARNTLSRLGE